MRLAVIRFLSLISIIFACGFTAEAQDLTRELKIASGSSAEIINRYGRVGITAAAAVGVKSAAGKFTAVIALSDHGFIERGRYCGRHIGGGLRHDRFFCGLYILYLGRAGRDDGKRSHYRGF